MNNKDFITALSNRLDTDSKETQKMVDAFVNELVDLLEDGDSLMIQGFGNFEVKKKLERVVVNPSTKQRMLVPPKLALTFRPTTALKEKFK